MNRRYMIDLAERVASTYAASYLGLWTASGLGMDFITDLSNADKALVSVPPALYSLLKGFLAKRVGDPNSASLAASVPAPATDEAPLTREV